MFIAPSPLAPTNLLGGCIAEYENVWINTEEIIERIEEEARQLPRSLQFEQATEYSVDTAQTIETNKRRTNTDLNVSKAGATNEFFRFLNNEYYLTVLGAQRWYQNHFDLPELHHAESYNLLKYQTGQEYKAHYDGGIIDRRCVSPILYLNDEYEGGELEFVHFGIKIKPKKGNLYLFPSNYAYSHIAHPVTEGTKYAIVTWLHGTTL
jgi:predicted 2-oxoglutarate/Fe(II)-dependent dioxygenase YbiX